MLLALRLLLQQWSLSSQPPWPDVRDERCWFSSLRSSWFRLDDRDAWVPLVLLLPLSILLLLLLQQLSLDVHDDR